MVKTFHHIFYLKQPKNYKTGPVPIYLRITVGGPRYNIKPVDLITAFNLFLYNVEVRSIYPAVAAEKVLNATDIRLVCFDKIETITDQSYKTHCQLIESKKEKAFNDIYAYKKTINPPAGSAQIAAQAQQDPNASN